MTSTALVHACISPQVNEGFSQKRSNGFQLYYSQIRKLIMNGSNWNSSLFTSVVEELNSDYRETTRS